MSEMIERVAGRLFWEAEHLYRSPDVVSEDELNKVFPEKTAEECRLFWRRLARAALQEMALT